MTADRTADRRVYPEIEPEPDEELESKTVEFRLKVAKLWARDLPSAYLDSLTAGLRGTLYHLRFALAEVDRLRDELAQMQAARDVMAQLYKGADSRLDAVLDLCDREERNAIRWENPIPVPEWVAVVQRAALGDDQRGEATDA